MLDLFKISNLSKDSLVASQISSFASLATLNFLVVCLLISLFICMRLLNIEKGTLSVYLSICEYLCICGLVSIPLPLSLSSSVWNALIVCNTVLLCLLAV